MSMKPVEYGAVKDIRIASEVAVEFPCIVKDTGITADENGKKIIKAGTPIGAGSAITASNNVLLARDTELQKDLTNAQGVILHDTDVTDGKANATIMVEGYVDLLKIDASIREEVAGATIPNIKFVKGRE